MQACNFCSPQSQEKWKCSRQRSYFGILTPRFLPTKLDLIPGVQQDNNYTRERETLIIYLRVVQAWMLRAFHISSTSTGLSMPLFIHRNSDLMTFHVQPLCYSWLVFSIHIFYITPADTSTCSGEGSAPGQGL